MRRAVQSPARNGQAVGQCLRAKASQCILDLWGDDLGLVDVLLKANDRNQTCNAMGDDVWRCPYCKTNVR